MIRVTCAISAISPKWFFRFIVAPDCNINAVRLDAIWNGKVTSVILSFRPLAVPTMYSTSCGVLLFI